MWHSWQRARIVWRTKKGVQQNRKTPLGEKEESGDECFVSVKSILLIQKSKRSVFTFHVKVKQNRYHSHIMHINIVLIYLVVDRGLHTFIMHMNVIGLLVIWLDWSFSRVEWLTNKNSGSRNLNPHRVKSIHPGLKIYAFVPTDILIRRDCLEELNSIYWDTEFT